MRLLVKMSVICLLACLLSACTSMEVTGVRDNIRIGPVPIIRVDF